MNQFQKGWPMSPSSIASPPPWSKIFIELAVRALLRVHHDYLLWSMPQDPTTEPDFRRLTNAPGAAFADEPTVCAAIAQEFVATRLTFGVHIAANEAANVLAGPRTWRIAREKKYPRSDKEVDFHIERIAALNTGEKWVPVWIEAKRAFLWTNHLGDFVVGDPLDQTKAIQADAKKLTEEIKVEEGFRSLLVWNVIDANSPKTARGPNMFLASFGDIEIIPCQVRHVPLGSYCVRADEADSPQQLKCNSSLWVALADVWMKSDLNKRPAPKFPTDPVSVVQ